MTDAEELPVLPRDLLRSWPGRLRSSDVLLGLYGQSQDRKTLLADDMLAGVAAGQDENAALDKLIADGEFAVAELVLGQSVSLSAKAVRKASNAIETGRSLAVSVLSDRLSGLSEAASAAGVDLDVDASELERLAYESLKAATALVNQRERDLTELVDQESRELRDRLAAADLPAATVRGAGSLINAGRLRAVRHLLDRGTLSSPGPEIQPALTGWRWQESPQEVLRWHVNPNVPRPRAFAEWSPPDELSSRLIHALDGLNASGEGSARAFAQALDAFLGPQAEPAAVHPVPGGFLTSIRNAFGGDPLTRFRVASTVPLFIAEPGVDLVPALGGVGHFLAVGTRLEPRGRGLAAVLSVRDLLRLGTVPPESSSPLGANISTGRAISFSRLVGSRWSLAGLGAQSAVELGTLLDRDDEETRWQTLSWLADLTGLGGSATADAVLFQAGGDLGVMHALLEYAVQLASRQPARWSDTGLRAWTEDRQVTDQIEAVALRDCQSTSALTAFWSAMAAAPAGTALTFDDLAVAASLTEDSVDWAQSLRAGWDVLARQWFTQSAAGQGQVGEPGGAETIRLRRCGVMLGLRGLAERRLKALASELGGDAVRDLDRDSAPSAWAAYQFALSPRWPEYRDLLSSGASAEQIAAVGSALEVSPDELLAVAESLTGQTDLTAATAELRDAVVQRYPGIELETDIPPGTVAGIHPRIALTVLHGLLSNAIEAVAGTGTIALAMRASVGDVIIDVRDTGPGLAAEVDSAFRVFRRGFSTRGTGRGQGLFVVRQLAQNFDGDAELVSRAGGHPVLPGAHFRVVLPRSGS